MVTPFLIAGAMSPTTMAATIAQQNAEAQMARSYHIPYRSGGNFTGSRIPDAQAGYESAGTMWPTVQAGTNFVLHAAAWLEGGLIAGGCRGSTPAHVRAMAKTG